MGMPLERNQDSAGVREDWSDFLAAGVRRDIDEPCHSFRLNIRKMFCHPGSQSSCVRKIYYFILYRILCHDHCNRYAINAKC